MTSTLPSWVLQASKYPVAFCQVREDAFIDQWVLEQFVVKNPNILMVASGGCTAAFLATNPALSKIHLVDPNAAQLGLARIKLKLLQTTSPPERLTFLGHLPMPTQKRAKVYQEMFNTLALSNELFGPFEDVVQFGLDYAGRYEKVFYQLAKELAPCQSEIQELLALSNPIEQSQRIEPTTKLYQQLEKAFATVMELPNLVKLFSAEATRNSVMPFSEHFFRRTLYVLQTLPAAENPYLAQVLLGKFANNVYYPWLQSPITPEIPEISYLNADMIQALSQYKEENKSFDFIHLSNILDWLSPEVAQETLQKTWEVLNPSGVVLIRQLNSMLDIPSFGKQFEWQLAGKTLHQKDRSYFYRDLHLGKKP